MTDIASQDDSKKETQPLRSNSGDASVQTPQTQQTQQTHEWIAEVSHELRLPIANVSLLVETLGRRIGRSRSGQAHVGSSKARM